jgi:hypothetical protein
MTGRESVNLASPRNDHVDHHLVELLGDRTMPATVTVHLPEQDHRAINRIFRPMMGYKDYFSTR